MAWQLAQINIARLIAPLNDPQVAGFVAELEPINALAESARGFVWRLTSDPAEETDPCLLVNISVWESIEALREFTYGSRHIEIFRDRAQWFRKAESPSYCLWWVPAGHTPSVAEGRERLTYYQLRGATPHSFWFSQPFPAQP